MPFSEHEIEEARNRTDIYASEVALRRSGSWSVGLCPFHSDRNPSFGVKDGRWRCFSGCGGGDVIEFYMRHRGVKFDAAVRELANLPTQKPKEYQVAPDSAPARDGDADATAAARRIWSESKPLDGTTHADRYLYSRALSGTSPSLRSHQALRCRDLDRDLPAMVAAIKDSDDRITAIQRTWLDPGTYFVGGAHGAGEAKGTRMKNTTKKTLGTMRDGCVRLSAPGPTLGFSEGIESGRSCEIIYRIPVFVTCGLSRLGNPAHYREAQPEPGQQARVWYPSEGERAARGVKTIQVPEREPSVWIPPEAQELIFFGDLGLPGVRAACYAAWAFGRYLPARAMFPDSDSWSDFNDQLRAQTLGTAIA